MILDARTLILLADGRRARLFEEARRGGPLTEHADWLAGVDGQQSPPAGWRGLDPAGREAGRDKAEAGFLNQVCRRLEAVFSEGRFDQLILIAAPRSLGHLRRHLSAGLRARLVLSEPRDRLAASLADIEQAVRGLRRLNA